MSSEELVMELVWNLLQRIDISENTASISLLRNSRKDMSSGVASSHCTLGIFSAFSYELDIL